LVAIIGLLILFVVVPVESMLGARRRR
jgi:hypothetical protein